jgi:hypothetical protein
MDERFDGSTGNGVLEIWLALKARAISDPIAWLNCSSSLF